MQSDSSSYTTSKNFNIRSLYIEKHNSNINADQVVEQANTTRKLSRDNCKKIVNEHLQVSKNCEKFMNLNNQNILVKIIIDNCKPGCISSWNKVANPLSNNFLRRAMILLLSTNKNLKTWNLIPREFCPLCSGDVHTHHHIFNNCSAAANQHRYTWWHNSVLNCIIHHLSPVLTDSTGLFVEIPGFDGLFTCAQSPDLVLTTSLKTLIIELTVCFETNLIKSRDYKVNRYTYLEDNIKDTGREVELILVEISSLGFYTDEIKPFKQFIKHLKLNPIQILEKCTQLWIRYFC